jgi:hypothetical protein
MGLLDKLFGKPKETPGRLTFLCMVRANEIILDKRQNSDGVSFEVLLFSSLHVLRKFRQRRPHLYDQFEAELFNELVKFTQEKGILNQLPSGFANFVNNRFELYGQQLNSIREDRNFLPTKMAFNFFETPLKLESGDCFDMTKVFKMSMSIPHLINFLDEGIEFIIVNCRL